MFVVVGGVAGGERSLETGDQHLQVWSRGFQETVGEGEGGEAVSSGENLRGSEDSKVGGRSPG